MCQRIRRSPHSVRRATERYCITRRLYLQVEVEVYNNRRAGDRVVSGVIYTKLMEESVFGSPSRQQFVMFVKVVLTYLGPATHFSGIIMFKLMYVCV